MAEQVARISKGKACELLQSDLYQYDVKQDAEGKWVMNLDEAIAELDPTEFTEKDWMPYETTLVYEIGIPKPRRPKN